MTWNYINFALITSDICQVFFGTDNKCYRIHVLKGLICVLMYVHRIFLMKWICLYFSLIFIISRNQYRYIYDHIFVLYRKAGTKAENRRNYSPPPLKYHNKYFLKNPLNSQGFFTKLYYLYFLNQVMPLRKCMHYICSGSLWIHELMA